MFWTQPLNAPAPEMTQLHWYQDLCEATIINYDGITVKIDDTNTRVTSIKKRCITSWNGVVCIIHKLIDELIDALIEEVTSYTDKFSMEEYLMQQLKDEIGIGEIKLYSDLLAFQ